MVFWAPDDFGNLTPDEDSWFSDQAEVPGSQADVHAMIDASHANGIAVTSYVKNLAGISGLQVKRDGLTLIRQHPEWAQYMANGQPKWFFDLETYRMTPEQRRARIQVKGQNDWFGIGLNFGELACVRYGAEEFVRAGKKYGFDGVRFDDHFTLESLWDGGITYDGNALERGGDFEALSVRSNRLVIDITRADNPNFLLGYNYGGIYAERGIRYPEAYAATCRDGQFNMLEWCGWWPDTLKTWGKVASALSAENHRVQGFGGVPGMMRMISSNPQPGQVGRWQQAINYASQGHDYTLGYAADDQYTFFMLRYGGLLYDEKAQVAPDGERLFTVATEGKCLWKDFIHARLIDATHQQLSVSIVNMDPDGVINTLPLPLPPLGSAEVTFTPPAGWKIEQAHLLDPDAPQQCVEAPFTLRDGKAQLTLRDIACWNLLVFDLSKR